MPIRPRAPVSSEERREILTSVMGVLAGNPPDPDEMAACSYLLKHLYSNRRAFGPQRVESVMMDS